MSRRTELAFALLSKHYQIEELDTKGFSTINVNGLKFTVKHYNIVNVGHLLVMDCVSPNMNMDTFTITPYFKNIPMFTSDFIYMGDKRSFLCEFYSLGTNEDTTYKKHIDEYRLIKDKYKDMVDMPMKQVWYEPIRPVCIAKTTDKNNEEKIFNIYLECLEQYIKQEQALQLLDAESKNKKKIASKKYGEDLINQGGPATNLFKAAIGSDKVNDFFANVFFGYNLY